MKRKLIYVNGNIDKHEFIISGISFLEFFNCFGNSIDNLLLLKGDYFGNRYVHNFELVEGKENIKLLANENVHDFGDFCFVDYSDTNSVENISSQQIAELLYLAHMYRPIKSPFWRRLNNRFAYLAHDDGFSCKLFCKNNYDFASLLACKIINTIKQPAITITNMNSDIYSQLLLLSAEGMLMDIDNINKSNRIRINIYSVGRHLDMDKVHNEKTELIESALNKKVLIYQNGGWYIE